MVLPLARSSYTHSVKPDVEVKKTYLGSDEEIPSLDEMSTDIPSGLSNNLHSDVVPIISSIRVLSIHSRNEGRVVEGESEERRRTYQGILGTFFLSIESSNGLSRLLNSTTLSLL